VIPDAATIRHEVDQQYQHALRTQATDALLAHFDLDAVCASLPAATAAKGLTAEQIRQKLDDTPTLNWREVITEKVEEAIQRLNLGQHVSVLLCERTAQGYWRKM
jgi:hypothetical protein